MLFRKRRREDSSSLSNGRSIGSVPRQHRDFGCVLTGAECDLARIHARPAQSIGFAFDVHDSPLHRMVILRRGSEVKTVLSAVRFFDNWALLFRTTPSPNQQRCARGSLSSSRMEEASMKNTHALTALPSILEF